MANGLAMKGMCSSPLWSQHVAPNSSSGSESTVGFRGGSGSESEGTRALWSSLGMVPMDSDELTGEASGEPAPREMGPYSSSSTESEEMRTGHTHQGVLSSALSAADTLSFGTDVTDTRRQRKKRKAHETQKTRTGSLMTEPVGLAQWCGHLTGSKQNNACLKNLCSDAEFASHELRSVAVSSNTQRRTPSR